MALAASIMTMPKSLSLASAGPAVSNALPADYLALMKPRVMSLVIFTALVGMAVSPGATHPVIAFAALLMIAIGAGASGALNMWVDADIDAVMTRTRARPIPAGQVTREEALAFGLVLSAGSVLGLGIVANWLAAALLAFTILFYAIVYSMWLKRFTAQNIVIGGAAGALPPVVADAAVSGTVGVESLVLFLLIFLWTPPHFWALALVKRGDYERAGVPMLPNVAGNDETRRQILLYSLLLAPCGLSPALLGFGGLASLAVGFVGGAGMIALSEKLRRLGDGEAGDKVAWQLFGFSILYLLVIFAVLLAESAFGLKVPLPWPLR
jgi:heme o synthase